MEALTRMLDYADHQRLEATILLYPRKPATITQAARRGTLAHFHDAVERLSAARGARFVDLTTDNPLDDSDFSPDFDHVTDFGNRKFATWALEGPLAFLQQPPERAAIEAGVRR
jgi:hypothetical protein